MITRAEEEAIERMVKQHGYAKVRRNLDSLIGETKWAHWLTVCNYLDRVHRRKRRKSPRRSQSDAVK